MPCFSIKGAHGSAISFRLYRNCAPTCEGCAAPSTECVNMQIRLRKHKRLVIGQSTISGEPSFGVVASGTSLCITVCITVGVFCQLFGVVDNERCFKLGCSLRGQYRPSF